MPSSSLKPNMVIEMRTIEDRQFDALIARGKLDEGDRIVGHILSRRQALLTAAGAGLSILLGCGGSGGSSSGTTSTPSTGTTSTGTTTTGTTGTGTTTTGTTGIDLVATPEVTEGPFFVDENLSRSDLVSPGSSRSTVTKGNPFVLNFRVYAIDATDGLAYPLEGAHVDLWHCDTIGVYSDEAGGGGIQSETTTGQTWLRGYQVTDASGAVSFSTIFPGWYTGRTTHFHFKIRTYNSAGNETHEFTSQLFATDALSNAVYAVYAVYAANSAYSHGTRGVTNANDNVYGVKQADGTAVGSSLLLTVAQSGSGSAAAYSASFNVAFKTS